MHGLEHLHRGFVVHLQQHHLIQVGLKRHVHLRASAALLRKDGVAVEGERTRIREKEEGVVRGTRSFERRYDVGLRGELGEVGGEQT